MTNEGQRAVMVCVTGQRSCERLIMHGAKLCEEAVASGQDKPPFHVVHCTLTGHNFMNTPYEADAIEYLFTCAQVAGAELSMLRANNAEEALSHYARAKNVGTIVMGATPDSSAYSMDDYGIAAEKDEQREDTGAARKESFANKLERRLPDVKFDVL